jgi:DNA-directed RNA polymerase specialized sigma24 family protein
MQAHVDGEDLVQVVHIILWQGLRSGKFEVRTPKALLALAKTLLIRQAARQWRKVKLNDPINSVETRLARTHLCRYLVATPFQRCQLSSFETADLVDRFMCGLDDIDQQLLLRRLDGLSTAEVAETLQVDSGFLRVRLGRMRKKFAGFCPELACQP